MSTSMYCLTEFCCCALQNELAILEFIHCLVETLDRYFSNVCELDLMFNLEMVCFSTIFSCLYFALPQKFHLQHGNIDMEKLRLTGLTLQAHFIVDEMLINGCIVDTNKQNILTPVQLLEKAM